MYAPPVLDKQSGTMLLTCAALVSLHTLTTSLGLHHLHAFDPLIGMARRASHKLDMASNVGDACGLQVSSSSSSSRSSRAVPQAGQAIATSAVSRTKPTPSRSAAPATEAQAEAASRAAAALIAEEEQAAAAAQQAKQQQASKKARQKQRKQVRLGDGCTCSHCDALLTPKRLPVLIKLP